MPYRSLALVVVLASFVAGCSCGGPATTQTPDAGHDAASAPDAPRDAYVARDAFVAPDAFVASDAFSAPDTNVDAAFVCDRPGYPVDSTATRSERTDVETAAADFATAHGSTPMLDATTAAIIGFSDPFAISYDTSIADPCMRAESALFAFIAANAAMLRMPTDMTARACDYDSVTDSEIVRIHGGTYDGRALIGQVNDLVMHISRSGMLRFWGGSYLPVSGRLFPTPCFDATQLESSLVGDSLDYMRFDHCVPGATGSAPIRANDTRTTGDSALFVDTNGMIHVARRVEVLLDPSNITPAEEGSDLYCCGTASLVGCVGAYVFVDEITLEILEQLPRCITC